MKPMKSMALFLILVLLAAAPVAMADDPVIKLSRGITNVVTSPVEYAVAFQKLADRNNPFETIVGGLIYGTVETVQRVLVGAYEIVTFFIPYPKDYKPVIMPENPIKEYQELQ